AVMLKLKQVGIQPGREVTLAASDDGVRVTGDGDANDTPAELPRDVAAHVFVSKR
ncbi:MAG: dihydrofolate reductase, partial [Dermatophilaceae bacterium]|nr:dihydrofolate reductase [Dermatophilaceae bacterium]